MNKLFGEHFFKTLTHAVVAVQRFAQKTDTVLSAHNEIARTDMLAGPLCHDNAPISLGIFSFGLGFSNPSCRSYELSAFTSIMARGMPSTSPTSI
jgi:hypothetical protein